MILFRFQTNHIGYYGVPHKYLDTTCGIPRLCVSCCHFLKTLWQKGVTALKAVPPRENATGTYVMRNGKLVKVSASAGIFDIFYRHNWFGVKQGERELHNFYVDEAQKGAPVDAAMRDSMKRYGNQKIIVGWSVSGSKVS